MGPVDAIGKHELFAQDLAELEDMRTIGQHGLRMRRNANRCRREPVILFARSVMHDPKVWVDLRDVRGWCLRLAETESSPRVHGELLSDTVAAFLEVDFQSLQSANVSQLPGAPNGKV